MNAKSQTLRLQSLQLSSASLMARFIDTVLSSGLLLCILQTASKAVAANEQ
jgi:hypothetical protein